jgi:cell division protein FtsW (lipid II flippase)
MRVVQTAAPIRSGYRRWAPGSDRDARVERLGLAATSVVVALGLGLAYAGQTADIEACDGARSPCVVNLSTLRHAADLAPWLTMFDEPHERDVVAQAIVEQRGRPDASGIEHVGALAAVTVPAAQVRGDDRLVILNERLRARAAAEAVPALSGSDLAALEPWTIVRTPAEYRTRMLLAGAAFMLAFWLAHAVRARYRTTGDPLLLPAVQLIAGLGVMTMTALRDPLRDMVVAGTVVGGIAAGCAIWTAASFVDFEKPAWRRSMLVPLSAALLLALALLLFGGGPAGSGAKVNLLGVQPVEAIRLLVAFALAAYFARRWTFLRQFSDTVEAGPVGGRRLRTPRWKDVRPLAITIAMLLAFFFLQKDLGPALVVSCVFLALYGVARARLALVLCGVGVLAAGFTAGYVLGVPATVTQRVGIWLDPWGNGLAGGDQVAHSLWALASGGVWGLGPGIGDPQLIPAGHTDLALAALGEELGWVGVACVLALLVLLVKRLLAIALRAPGDYTFFLTLALTLLLAVQAIVIIGGTLGVLPLAGVVAPFLSYGRSSMLSNLALVGVCAAVARRQGGPRTPFVVPMRAIRWTLATAAVVLATRAALVQVVYADDVAIEANLTEQADGGLRYQHNPRLVAAGRNLVRGTIYDRTGLPLATSRPEEMAALAGRFNALGVTVSCPDAGGGRCYPLGGMAFHVLGNADRQINWAAPNTSFAEREMDAHLKGFDDRPRRVEIRHPDDGHLVPAVRRDFSELLPLVRHRGNPGHRDVRRLVDRDRDVHLSLDAGLQVLVARALATRTAKAGAARGAAIVIDPRSGELLASASYPWPTHAELSGAAPPAPDHLLDRARYGLYPPGSTFKIVTAVAAYRSDPVEPGSPFRCVRLSDGRVGGRVVGLSRPVRDDAQNTSPHGALDLHRALVVSCNAYFANLARQLGSAAVAEAAAAAQITVAPAPVEANLERTLPHAGYGQGDVLATPLRMARATAALAADGRLRQVHVTPAGAGMPEPVRWVSEAAAAQLRRDMRDVVRIGTGRTLAAHAVAIAGKTGTAELDGARAHAWFVGFAPYDEATAASVAFAVVVENGGSGGRIAAPLAGDVVSAARARGLLE